MIRTLFRFARPGWCCRALFGTVSLGLATWGEVSAQSQEGRLPIPPTRTIAFETSEGSFMNLDLSPDGRTIVFDLLGDIYTVPVHGGRATQLTRGLSYDRRPVWSPDGTQIAYVSDASGAENLWIMAADGTHPRPVARERTFELSFAVLPSFTAVEWLPGGHALVSDDTVYELAGGKRHLAGVPVSDWARLKVRFSSDGRYTYFTREGVRRYDRATGETVQLAWPPVDFGEAVVSPDGRWLAYVTRGEPYNGLRVRNLETGEDRWLAYPIDKGRVPDLHPYERYVFTPDAKAVLIAYGGKLHRIAVATGADTLIPFTAKVNAELGAFVYHRFRVTNDSVSVRYIRSPALSPDGKTLAFTALQRLYTMALPNGTPKRLLRHAEYGQFEPAYSPDGKWIAYVSWSDVEGGHVWRIPATGGTPERLTPAAGYYQRPVWSPDGRTLAILNAGTKDARPQYPVRGWLQLLPSTGGTPRTVLEGVSREHVPTFTPDGQYLRIQGDGESGQGEALVSIRLDGHDRQVLARASDGRQPGRLLPSPDGRYVAYVLREDLYLAPLPGAFDTVTLGESTGAVPVVRLTQGALDLRWAPSGRMLTWVVANQVFRLDADRVMAAAARTSGERVAPDTVTSIRLMAPRRAARGTVALRGARVITMRGAEVLENATLVITNDRITAVGPATSVVIPEGATVLDVRGTTIMPGLVDLHAHFQWWMDERFLQHDWTYQTALAYGVTTARDPARNTSQFGDAELLETGQMLGPRLFTAGNAILLTRIESLEDARAVARYHGALGGVFVKQYMQPTRRQRQWVLRAAAEAGLNVTNEAGHDVHESLMLALDGTTGVEHSTAETSLYGDVTRLFAEAQTWYTPTLQVGYGGQAKAYFRERYRRLYDEPKYRRFVPQKVILESSRSGELLRPGDGRYEGFIEAAWRAAEIVHQGGHVALGSHGEDQGLGVHWELWALQMGGLTNHEALRAATLSGAEGLGLQQDLGSLEVGKLADLLILDKDPLENIEHTLTIRCVMKNGVLYDGNTLSLVWPKKQALPAWMYEDTR